MKSTVVPLSILLIALAVTAPTYALDRKAIVQAIIQESIDSYAGNCPCPYNRDRAGRMCGRRSAYSKPGGVSPICYDKDITDEMIAAHQRNQSR